jgi:hypothetical protein
VSTTPTIYEWAGGTPAFERWLNAYDAAFALAGFAGAVIALRAAALGRRPVAVPS